MQISAIQIDVRLGDTDFNLRQAAKWIRRAGREGSNLAVLPECMLAGYCFDSREEAFKAAIRLQDERWQMLIESVSEHQMHAVVGFLECDEQGRLFNAAAIVGPQGIVGSYRKVHLPQLGVDRFVDGGSQPYQVYPVGDALVGLAICYDSSFPEPSRVLGLKKADIIALPTNWPVAAVRTAEVVPPARSMENHLYFVAANRVGQERRFLFCGRSSIHGPDGVELARAVEDSEQILHAEADLAQARNKRIERTVGAHVIDRFADRRPAFYGPIVEPLE